MAKPITPTPITTHSIRSMFFPRQGVSHYFTFETIARYTTNVARLNQFSKQCRKRHENGRLLSKKPGFDGLFGNL